MALKSVPPRGRKVVNRKGVADLIGKDYSPQHLNKKIAAGEFPKGFQLGGPTSPRLWFESDILDWLETKTAAR